MPAHTHPPILHTKQKQSKQQRNIRTNNKQFHVKLSSRGVLMVWKQNCSTGDNNK